ncbi:TPR-like protein [Coprinopsis marcescibilis]|uniref:TPR-like protein n=1 Tax=Coprinopsis marcescibilis TaxID=230819 RepID=A0A5C3KV28_COPMA|nr:TPR-like protein [Coprinopsis marcescibilis]
MSLARVIVIDDDHPDIVYGGTWEIDPVQYEGFFNSGNVGGSQRRITGVDCLGSGISLYGTRKSLMNQALKWQCRMDGEVFEPIFSPELVQNTYQYCHIAGLDPSTAHTLRVNIEASEQAPFWVDAIEFYPFNPSVAYREALARNSYYSQHHINDTTIQYSPGWQFLPEAPIVRFTSTPNSIVEIAFIGTQVTWKGIALINQPLVGDSQATYSVDEGPPVPIIVPQRLAGSGQYQLFETEKLPRNLHHLKVVYGAGSEAPLVLNYMLIADGDILYRDPRDLGPDLDGLRVDPVMQRSNEPQPEGPPAAAIAGGVVGGVVGLVILVFGIIYVKKMRDRKKHVHSSQRTADAEVQSSMASRSSGASKQVISPLANTNNPNLNGASVTAVGGDHTYIIITHHSLGRSRLEGFAIQLSTGGSEGNGFVCTRGLWCLNPQTKSVPLHSGMNKSPNIANALLEGPESIHEPSRIYLRLVATGRSLLHGKTYVCTHLIFRQNKRHTVVPCREAVDIWRRLANSYPAQYEPILSETLDWLASALIALQRYSQVAVDLLEVISLQRRLATQHPAKYNPRLARSLHRHSTALSKLGRYRDSLMPCYEAAAMYRRLMGDGEGRQWGVQLARVLQLQTCVVYKCEGVKSALQVAREGVILSRKSVDQEKGMEDCRALASLASALQIYAKFLGLYGRMEVSGEAVGESVALWRQLVNADAAKYTNQLRRAVRLENQILRMQEVVAGSDWGWMSIGWVNWFRRGVGGLSMASFGSRRRVWSLGKTRFMNVHNLDPEACRYKSRFTKELQWGRLKTPGNFEAPLSSTNLGRFNLKYFFLSVLRVEMELVRWSLLWHASSTAALVDVFNSKEKPESGTSQVNGQLYMELLPLPSKVTPLPARNDLARDAKWAMQAISLLTGPSAKSRRPQKLSDEDRGPGSSQDERTREPGAEPLYQEARDLTSWLQSVDRFRQLAAEDPSKHGAEFAYVLDTLAFELGIRRRHDEAIPIVQESIHIKRRLLVLEDSPAQYPLLAASLHNLAVYLASSGYHLEALDHGREAALIRLQLAASNPTNLVDGELANTRHNLACDLAFCRRYEEAMPVFLEAVTARRRLAVDSPKQFKPLLARSLHQYALCLANMGRHSQAVESGKESAAIQRRLAQKPNFQVDAVDADLACTLHNLSCDLSSCGLGNDAVNVAREALTIRRRLAERQPAIFVPLLAKSLHHYAIFLANLGSHAKAVKIGREAVDIRFRLLKDDPEKYRLHLSASLYNLAFDLVVCNRDQEAIPLSQEGIGLRRQLVAQTPTRFEHLLAASLRQHSIYLSRTGLYNDAVKACQESVDIFRRLGSEADLSRSLKLLGSYLSSCGRDKDAEVMSLEAKDLRRRAVSNSFKNRSEDAIQC